MWMLPFQGSWNIMKIESLLHFFQKLAKLMNALQDRFWFYFLEVQEAQRKVAGVGAWRNHQDCRLYENVRPQEVIRILLSTLLLHRPWT